MNKSPWVILIIGVIGIVVLAVLGKTYLGHNLQLQLKTELVQNYGIEGVCVQRDEATGEIVVAYQIQAASFAHDNASIDQQMQTMSDFAYKRFAISKIRITASSPDGSHTHTRSFAYD